MNRQSPRLLATIGLVAVLMAAGCGTDDSNATSETSGGQDASSDAGGSSGGDAAVDGPGADGHLATDAPAEASQDAWKKVDEAIEDAFQAGKVQGPFVTLEVFDAAGNKLHSVTAGDAPSHDEPIAVASASKWVSSTVFLSVVQDGLLSLDDTTGEVLGWTETEVKDITLA